jgi:hypothetical protein
MHMALMKRAREQDVQSYSEHAVNDRCMPETSVADAQSYRKHFGISFNDYYNLNDAKPPCWD